MRSIAKLMQNWQFTGPDGSTAAVVLPHTWNAKDGQDGGNDYYRGTCCYTTVLPDIVLPENGRAVLQEHLHPRRRLLHLPCPHL